MKRRFPVAVTGGGGEAEQRPKQHHKVLQEREEEEEVGGRGADEEAGEGEGDAKPVGKVIMVTGKGRIKRKYYKSFEYDGNVFELGDTVLLTPEQRHQKPYVARIKDIIQDADGQMTVVGQWFYRPEEARRKDGRLWPARDSRELFYSFHLDETPADSVMHKCIVHFVPLHKQLPVRSEYPGFIVQNVYDFVEKKLVKLTDKDFKDIKQHEIDLLVQETQQRLGKLPDIEPEDSSAFKGDQLKSLKKRVLPIDVSKGDPSMKSDQQRKAEKEPEEASAFKGDQLKSLKKRILPIDVSSGDPSTKSDQASKAEKPGNYMSDIRKYHALLGKFKALTGKAYRDRWLDKLLQGLQQACNSNNYVSTQDKEKSYAPLSSAKTTGNDGGVAAMVSEDKGSNAGEIWRPDVIIPAITELEMVTYEALGTDFQKYNQKMRQLDFNLKNNPLLARRLLNKELEPIAILSMSPNELKDGLTADERTPDEPEKSEQMQMTDARCSRCMEKKVGVADIIQAGGRGDRYQLECIACGHKWYASRDAIVSFAVDEPNVVVRNGGGCAIGHQRR